MKLEKRIKSTNGVARPIFGRAKHGILLRKYTCRSCVPMSGESAEYGNDRQWLQRSALYAPPARSDDIDAPPVVHDVLRSRGEPMDPPTRAFFEPRFGHDFSHVRVHTDAKAAESACAVDALAYTVGRHVVFGAGRYEPGTSAGRHLLAHELVHVVQQSAATSDQPNLSVGPADGPAEAEAHRLAAVVAARPATSALNVKPNTSPAILARQPSGQGAGPRRTARGNRPLVSTDIDTAPATIDTSKGIDQITEQFYEIPIALIPPNTPIPSGPILTLGPYGCSIRRYGLTTDHFSLSFELDERDIRSRSHPFMSGTNLQTVECWTDHVAFRARIRNTILIPSDIGTHPCLEGEDRARFRAETLAHERLHEADNNRAAEETLQALRQRLAFTLGVGSGMAMASITDDPAGFVDECKAEIRNKLESRRSEYEVEYARISAEYASRLDPHDRELHELKLRLLEQARARAAESR